MGERRELDPFEGAFRWALRRGHAHLGGALVGAVGLPVAAGVVGAFVDENDALHTRIEAGVAAGLATFVIVGIVVGVVALLLAFKEQRDELRERLGAQLSDTERLIQDLQHQFFYKGAYVTVFSDGKVLAPAPGIVLRNNSSVPVKYRVEVLTFEVSGQGHGPLSDRREGVVPVGEDAMFACGAIQGVPIAPLLTGSVEFDIYYGPTTQDAWAYRTRQKHTLVMWPLADKWQVSTSRIEHSTIRV